MTITVEASNVKEAAAALGLNKLTPPITITWRKSERFDAWKTIQESGCIVNAVGLPGEEVPKAFKDSKDAIKYISDILLAHDEYVMAEQKKEPVNA